MSIRLIVTDIDGTFFDDAHNYDVDRFNAQYAEMQKQGIRFAVASGNQLPHLHYIFDRKSPLTTFVAENGSHIVDGAKVISETMIPMQTVHELLTHLAAHEIFDNAHVRLSGKQNTYLQANDPTINDDIVQYYLHDIAVVPDLMQVNDEIYKVNLDWRYHDIETQSEKLNALFGDYLHATPSGSGSIDIIPNGVNKAFGIDQLRDYWQLSKDEIMAFGDNFNDLEMLQHVKHGYVMKNATKSMHEFGLPTTPLDNNHSGVLDMIDRVLTGTFPE
ncbi:Cof-type HAD-IIB family hydrolase [Agrilactobacillus yilanensis]|uniref:Cof-type HAD-IIB family hydrolase n=1 Tax=Agrilactobacillus yilanensis TaxID=2485997 RepID=A0ABW4J533_9LACO|nr:Cof-type HAD-IIB family hydrolase [Agrilactobacillus yilanensis]